MKDQKEQVVLYGLGNAGKSLLPYLRKYYEILFWADADENLWGTEFEGIPVGSPQSITEYDGRVIVTTTDTFFAEISDYLRTAGFNKNDIFRGQHPVCDQRAELVPYEVEMLKPVKINLSECDLLHRGEEKKSYRVMILCGFYSSYVNQLVRNCKKRMPDVHFGILSNSEEYLAEMRAYADHIYIYHSYAELYGILCELPEYDVFQLLWIENIWVYFRKQIRNKCRRLNLCVGGSDLYRARPAEQIYKGNLIDIADNISAETDATMRAFVERYPSAAEKIRWVNFGLESIEYMGRECLLRAREKRKSMDIPDGGLVIMCGYNASDAHQHVRMIRALNKLDQFIKEKVTLVFPMTYPKGQERYIEEIRNQLDSCGIDYRILTEYMSGQGMAEIELMSDILITVQKTDQLSSTMLETMYAGKAVIAGSWLPYENLRERGMFFVSVNEITDLTRAVTEAAVNYREFHEKCAVNKQIIYDMSSWDTASSRWRELWEN